MKTKIISLALLLVLLAGTGLGCRGGSSDAQQAALENITLHYWRVFDDDDDLDGIIDDYRALHPNVTIKVTKKRFEEFEEELVQAFAEDRGPDMFSIHNTWIGQYEPLITPMPESVSLVYHEIQGSLKQEVVAVIRENDLMSLGELDDDYAGVVYDDVVRKYQASSKSRSENRIWALPYSVDTLALFYNEDLLDAAGIAEPPTNWEDFQEHVFASAF